MFTMYVYILIFSILVGQSIGQDLEVITLNVRFPTPRREPAAVYDGQDSIYTWGGSDGQSEWKREIFKYSISTRTLQQIGTMKEGVGDYGNGVWMGNENLLHFGGRNIDTGLGTRQIYNFKTDDADSDWTLVSNLPMGCYQCAGVWDEGENTYIIGGRTIDNSFMNAIYKYSSVNKQTQLAALLPSARYFISAVLDNARNIFIFGGDSSSGYLNDIVRFDLNDESVTKLSAVLPIPVAGTCPVWVGEEAYIIGGYGSGTSPQIVSFNPSTSQVESLTVTNFPDTLYWTGCVFVEKLKRIYILGGYSPLGGYRDQLMYIDLDPASTTTTETTINTETTEVITSEAATTTKVTKKEGCLDRWKKCFGWDEFGSEWEGRPSETTSRSCPREEAGMSEWECLPNGDFEGQTPNFTNCSTKWLDDLDGNWTADVLLELEKNTHKAKYSNSLEWKYYGHEIQKILDVIKYILKNIELVEPDIFRVYVDHALRICWNMLTNHGPWNQLENRERPTVAISLLKTMESSLFEFSSRKLMAVEFSGNGGNMEIFQFDEYTAMAGIFLGSERTGLEPEQESISFPENCKSNSEDSCIHLTLDSRTDDLIYAAMKIQLGFHSSLLPGSSNTLGPNGHPLKDKVLNGPIMTFTTVEFTGEMNESSTQIGTPAENISVNYRHEVFASGSRNYNVTRRMHSGELAQAVRDSSVCVFWDEENFIWSTEGCKLVHATRTTSLCHCDHLTYFALLMDIHEYHEKDLPLEILTIVLVGLSIICLLICITIFTTDTTKEGQSPRMFILKHLCICLLLANAFMLVLVDRNYLPLSEGVCTAVAVLTQYMYLTAFLWMGIEGLYLFQNVVFVFDVTAGTNTLWKFRIAAFGLPILIMCLTTVVGHLNDDRVFGGINYALFSCWLEGYYIWSFLAPVAVIVSGNTVSVFLAVRAAYKCHKNVMKTELNAKEFRFRLRGFFGLTITLGIAWVFGFFLLIPDSIASIVTAYVFCILTGSQGILIAVFYILLNKRIRESLKKKMEWPDFSLRAKVRNSVNSLEIREPIGNRLGMGMSTVGVSRRNVGLVRNWEDEFNTYENNDNVG